MKLFIIVIVASKINNNEMLAKAQQVLEMSKEVGSCR